VGVGDHSNFILRRNSTLHVCFFHASLAILPFSIGWNIGTYLEYISDCTALGHQQFRASESNFQIDFAFPSEKGDQIARTYIYISMCVHTCVLYSWRLFFPTLFSIDDLNSAFLSGPMIPHYESR